MIRFINAGWSVKESALDAHKFYLAPPHTLNSVHLFLQQFEDQTKNLAPEEQVPGRLPALPDGMMPSPPVFTTTNHFSALDLESLLKACAERNKGT